MSFNQIADRPHNPRHTLPAVIIQAGATVERVPPAPLAQPERSREPDGTPKTPVVHRMQPDELESSLRVQPLAGDQPIRLGRRPWWLTFMSRCLQTRCGVVSTSVSRTECGPAVYLSAHPGRVVCICELSLTANRGEWFGWTAAENVRMDLGTAALTMVVTCAVTRPSNWSCTPIEGCQ